MVRQLLELFMAVQLRLPIAEWTSILDNKHPARLIPEQGVTTTSAHLQAQWVLLLVHLRRQQRLPAARLEGGVVVQQHGPQRWQQHVCATGALCQRLA